ncbi:MAG TPA: DUF429 domain-containing protein [Acidimicrobiales bacterium]|nr:DUF429 domain-containing protein [Acidimicrobiales bacterium]
MAAPAPDAQYLGVEGDKRLVGGMDGCRGGWVLVTTPVYGMGDTSIEVVPSIDAVVERLEKGELTAVAIDIPISLPASGPRRCDTDARKMIGPRRNSVFPAPFRGLLGSATYEEAASRSRSISGKSLSRQAFAVLPKIEEVDALMTPERQRVLIEVHPEVSFTALRGRPMEHHKSTSEGRGERLAALRTVFHDVDDVTSVRLPRTNPDDILDALVAAWSARRWMTGTYKRLGGDLDERGLRMEMIA